MAKDRQTKHYQHNYKAEKKPTIQHGATTPVSGGKDRNIIAFISKTPSFFVEFIIVWVLLYFLYGDLFLVAEQRSFFCLDSVAMQFYLSQPLGWLYYIGRMLLVSCKFPVLGTLLISAMLVGAAWLLDRAFKLSGRWHMFTIALPYLYFLYIFYMGLNLVYLRELSWVINVPFILFVASLLVALATKILVKRNVDILSFFKPLKNSSLICSFSISCLVLLLTISSVVVAMTCAQNDRITCRMESLMYDEEWDKMVEVAKSATKPSRTVIGLYALALNQNGQMATELFNIPMQYGNIHITNADGSFNSGIDYVVVYCNFYAGLTRSAYHEAMEQHVLEGPSISRLKFMVKCALIDHENALAEKYLSILKKVPFESEFVEKYSDMLTDYYKVVQDNELASVIELQPVKDSFEQAYRKPLFLGYNVSLLEAKSIRGLNNCLYACLYSKDLKSFGARIVTMIQNNVMLSKIFEEAIVVQNIKNLSVLKSLKLSPYTLQQMKDFMGECFATDGRSMKDMTEDEKHELSKKKALEFKDKYLGTYEYYYYFQNVPDENYVVPEKEDKGGVN